jgi:dihydrofolate reductase
MSAALDPIRLTLVVAAGRRGEIGLRNGLPFRLKDDMAHFRAVTRGRPVLMGRKTWESLPKRPLPARPNVVVTRRHDLRAEGAFVATSLAVGIAAARAMAARLGVEDVCVIGGAEIYAAMLPLASRLWLTEVEAEVEADAFFPPFDRSGWKEEAATSFPAGGGNEYAFTIRDLRRLP